MVRAVFFDAVGTLLHPQPAAAQVYAEIGQRLGSRLSSDEIRARFSRVFRDEEAHDRAAGNVTSPAREEQRWRTIVARVLDDVADRETCFQLLWQHFAEPASWRIEPDTGPMLTQLADAGLLLGLASNFDARLHAVRAGFRELDRLHHVIVSAEVGHRKPGRGFFAELSRCTGLPGEAILLVGDDPVNDLHGARAAGLSALLLAATGEADSLCRLSDLPRYLGVV